MGLGGGAGMRDRGKDEVGHTKNEATQGLNCSRTSHLAESCPSCLPWAQTKQAKAAGLSFHQGCSPIWIQYSLKHKWVFLCKWLFFWNLFSQPERSETCLRITVNEPCYIYLDLKSPQIPYVHGSLLVVIWREKVTSISEFHVVLGCLNGILQILRKLILNPLWVQLLCSFSSFASCTICPVDSTPPSHCAPHNFQTFWAR